LICDDTESQIEENLNTLLDEIIQGIQSNNSNSEANDFRETLETSKDGKIKPFTESFLPEGILRINSFERALTGGIGASFEECAKLIGAQTFEVAERSFTVRGDISKKAIGEIELMTNHVKTHGRPDNFLDWVKKVVELSSEGETEERKETSDVYLKDKEGNELFFEIKSPKPNKGQCIEVTERHLNIHAIKKNYGPKVRAFFAMGFNPYGTRELYKWGFVVKNLDLENHVLLGKEFWDLIGGSGTYEQLVQIYRKVGKSRKKDILKKLRF